MAFAVSALAACATSLAHIVIDFDGTCTQTDTTPLVPHLAARGAPSASAASSILNRFGELEAEYFALLSEAKAKALPPAASDATAFDPAGLEAALSVLDAASEAITEKLGDEGILAGIDPDGIALALDEWRAAASDPPVTALRDGCEETLAAAAAQGVPISVLSLNWCPGLIQAFLPILVRANSVLHCNAIDPASGRVSSTVSGAVAKRDVIARLKADAAAAAAAAAAANDGGGGDVLYLGDSSTDLLALLESDIGILIGESTSAREIARRFGVALEPLPAAKLPRCPDGVVWQADSWQRVRECLGL